MNPRRLRDVDSAAQARRIHAFGMASWAGLPGALLGFLFGDALGVGALLGALLGFAAATLIVGGIALALGSLMARVGGSIFAAGASLPATREYSLADALAARGRHQEAAAELRRCVAQYPDDPEPRLRLARLERDALAQPEAAAATFRSVLAMPNLPPATEQLAGRELIDLYNHRLRQPRAAAPWLARLAQKFPESPTGTWAREELSSLKQWMREDENRGA